jgi:hypothetical protein
MHVTIPGLFWKLRYGMHPLEIKLHLNWLSLDYTLSDLPKTEQTDG